jgi:hypothetical protein
MEVYVLDDVFRRTEVVDRFESLIWTERYSAYGDFSLQMHSTAANRSLLAKGTRLALNESSRVMTIETIEDKRSSDGKHMLSLQGRSLEQIMEDRTATDSWMGTELNPNWALTGAPAAIARTIFNTICRTGFPNTADKIPFLEAIITNQLYTRPEPGTSITVELELQSVYEAIKNLCEAYGMGFYLVRIGDTSKLRFSVYTGNDRTLGQTTLVPVVFGHDLGTLSDTTELTSTENYKNVAYVFAKNGSAVIYAPGTDPAVSGFDRRVMTIKADDLTDPAGDILNAKMTQKGYEELAKARGTFAFDGEIPQRGSYKYGKDYFLGDLVTMRNSDGVNSSLRVSEQIFVSDGEGDRAYPTLSVELTATPGSWAAGDPTDTWGTATTETWSNP